MDSVPLLIDIDHFILLDIIRPAHDVLLFFVTTNRLPDRQRSLHFFQPGLHFVVIEVKQKNATKFVCYAVCIDFKIVCKSTWSCLVSPHSPYQFQVGSSIGELRDTSYKQQ